MVKGAGLERLGRSESTRLIRLSVSPGNEYKVVESGEFTLARKLLDRLGCPYRNRTQVDDEENHKDDGIHLVKELRQNDP